VNLLDSSAWLEFFIDGPDGERYAPLAEDTDTLLVPVVCLYEVLRRLQGLGLTEEAALARRLMERGQVIELTADRAAAAVAFGVKHKLPMADSMIYAIAREFDATLWTQVADFDGLPGVANCPKRPR
jgi:predicted nucleic acid-binding protein